MLVLAGYEPLLLQSLENIYSMLGLKFARKLPGHRGTYTKDLLILGSEFPARDITRQDFPPEFRSAIYNLGLGRNTVNLSFFAPLIALAGAGNLLQSQAPIEFGAIV